MIKHFNFFDLLARIRRYRWHSYNEKMILCREDVQVLESIHRAKKILHLDNDATRQVYLRSNTSDYLVFKQVLLEKQYEAVLRHIRHHNIEVNTVIDCGANIGLTTLYFHHAFPNAKYVCVEPDKDNFKALERNLQHLNIQALLLRAGVWSHDAYLKTSRSFRDGSEWSISVVESQTPTDLKGVSISTLQEKYDLNPVDILKIDIEGAESVLFFDKSFVEKVLPAVKLICLEVHEEKIETSEVQKILCNTGFEVHNSGELTIGLNLNLL